LEENGSALNGNINVHTLRLADIEENDDGSSSLTVPDDNVPAIFEDIFADSSSPSKSTSTPINNNNNNSSSNKYSNEGTNTPRKQLATSDDGTIVKRERDDQSNTFKPGDHVYANYQLQVLQFNIYFNPSIVFYELQCRVNGFLRLFSMLNLMLEKNLNTLSVYDFYNICIFVMIYYLIIIIGVL
jgi:hypothetical protein